MVIKLSKPIEIEYCDYCERRLAGTAVRECEICGAIYCRSCAVGPDEGGWDCPDRKCPGHPCL